MFSVKFSAAILSGGVNSRFGGRMKSLIKVFGTKIIDRQTDVLASIFDEILLVTNTPEYFSGRENIRVCGDLFADKGPLGGIHSALINATGEAVFIIAGDMPFIDAGMIKRQLELALLNDGECIVPGHGSFVEPLHAVYSKSILTELEFQLRGNGDLSIRNFLDTVKTTYIDMPEHSCFLNINTPEQLYSIMVPDDDNISKQVFLSEK